MLEPYHLDRIPPKQWLHLYRSLLRECSYLPDPIARPYMHEYVVDRFRRYTDDRRPSFNRDLQRHHALYKTGLGKLKLLERANQGYSRHLEKVLRLAYGRKGKRRKALLDALVPPEVPANTAAVMELIQKARMYEDGWEPPSILMDLLKSQHNNGVIAQLNHRQVKHLEPSIPKANTWGRPVNMSRRKNIRQQWYMSVLESLLPPLPDAELEVLEGLISGRLQWKPPKKRAVLSIAPPQPSLDAEFLTDGPRKGHTFRVYANGRPHNITRRFMTRLWKRISCLVPRMVLDPTGRKHVFMWDMMRPIPSLHAEVKDKETKMFEGIDCKGKVGGD
ncbi:hypothetical protein BDV59DRAFT_179986 [Aspergillus ambiguus]|uniref:uncharacterized protein n=1 Tax=Aspergillus ambiguus TaxID=176160 RepID=UPI003CCD11F1